METTLSDLASQIDGHIEARLFRKCRAEYLAAKGNRKTCPPFRYSMDVTGLLDLRQRLYSGEDPEAIAATVAQNFSHF